MDARAGHAGESTAVTSPWQGPVRASLPAGPGPGPPATPGPRAAACGLSLGLEQTVTLRRSHSGTVPVTLLQH